MDDTIPPSAPAPIVTPVTIPTGTPLPTKRNFLPWIIGGAIVAFLLIIIIGVIVGASIIGSLFHYTPAPPPPPPPPEVTVKPIISRFASDSAILDLRDQLKTISKSIDSVDLIEPQISPPALDLNINIKQN